MAGSKSGRRTRVYPCWRFLFCSLPDFDHTDPQNEFRTLDAILKAYNQSQQPGRFELLALDDGSFVAVGNAAAHGPQTPILNTKITLNIGPISAEEALGQWGRELTVASGIQVEGGSPMANNFLIQKQITVQAENLPARDVLRQIIEATGRHYSWRLLFDHDVNSYFLNLTWSQKPREIAQPRQLSPHSYALLVFAASVTDPLYLQQVAALHRQNNSLPPPVEFVAVLEDATQLQPAKLRSNPLFLVLPTTLLAVTLGALRISLIFFGRNWSQFFL
jgi:hypothetical protein